MFGLFAKSAPAPLERTPLLFFNTASQSLEEFATQSAKPVTIYTCGPTVYDFAHIGNLRSYVFADLLKRTLIYHGYAVKHTINLTDFGHLTDDADAGEDKMMKGLKREGLPVTLAAMRQLSDTYIKAFRDDLDDLDILPPDTYARASDYVREQISLIETLEEKGYTYETTDGVYFDIAKFPAYGALGSIDLEALRSGARIEVNPEKRHPADFAVWKKGLLGWDSRWGKGFPGWHIECSAMAMATLGKTLDFHTGGIDHIPVHHNAEIAQSESATGKPFARFWLHNAFITIDSTKISKSLGNTLTLRHLHDQGFAGGDYRYWLLTAHYRSPANFSFEALKAAKQARFRLKRFVYEEYKNASGTPATRYVSRFRAAMADDLDTPQALALMWEVTKDATLSPGEKCATLRELDSVLAIGLNVDADQAVRELGVVDPTDIPGEVQTLLAEREAARIARNWGEADRLREAINLKGYAVEDTPHGPKLTRA